MKRTSSVSMRSHLMKTTQAFLIILIFATTACKKEYQPEKELGRQAMPTIKAKNQLVLESIVLNDSVVKMKCQNNLRQLGLSVHNYDNGTLKNQMAFEYDRQGNLMKTTVKNLGYFLHEHNSQGKIVRSKFFPTNSSAPAFTVNYEYGNGGTQAADFLIWQRFYGPAHDSIVKVGTGTLVLSGRYDYNPDGTIRSAEVYTNNGSSKPAGRILFYNNATAAQVKVWKQLMEWYPVPEKPFEILSMLSNKVEMQGTGRVSDDVIVDGRIITAENFDFNVEGYLLKKETTMADSSGGRRPGGQIQIESFSWGENNF